MTLSWGVVDTLFTLRYAHGHRYVPPPGIDFGDAEEAPDYRDFAYVAFTIGMTYQVSRARHSRRSSIRRIALGHALLSYLFGVVIVATSISLIADLLR